ncbi:hypothetical protein ABMA27_002989 [Loxostege sticticalis]|uniref:CCHC-type domain-containing protein n=1 Tax=Loxostege sticticalis TaxID=481309 RepID=A0ABR3HRN8_LOXSC
MLALKARFGEPLEQYFYSKLNLLNRCNIKGRQAVDCILHGIEDRSIRLGAQAAQFDLPEQVLKYLKTVKVGNTRESVLNANRARADKRHLNNKPTMTKNAANSSKPPIKCFNCGLEGHPSFLCTKPIEKCSGCYRIGHKITSCPNAQSRGVQPNEKSNGKEKQVLRVCVSNTSVDKNITILNVENDHLLKEKSLSDNSRDKYFMTIEVNHKPLDCYVDLGSECSLIRRTDALKLGVEQDSDNLPLLKGVGNNCLRAMSRIEANVNVQGITLPIYMYVFDDSAIKQPILLGQNFTEHPSIMITKTPSQLIFEDSSSMHKLCLTTQKTTTIPQQDIKAIPVICSTPYSGKIYVHGSVRGKAGAEYFLLPGEYELSEGKGNLLVQNIAAGPIKFLSNSLITHAIPVSSAREVFDISKIDIDYNTLNCGSLINDDQKQELKSLLDRYSDCFSNNLKDLGFTSATEMEIHLSDSDPIVYRPYRMAQSERTLVRDMVQEMLDANIIRESSSPYASPNVLVKKKTGEKRLCIDYRALNRKTIKDHYPLPRRNLDRKLRLSLQFEYLRMPFGLVNAPSIFQRTINKILAEAKIKYAMVYMDDILIPAHDFSEGLARLQELSKCYFFYDKIDYLGFEVGSEGIRPGSCKTEAVSTRWWVQLQEFDCSFEYRSGVRMAHVDALSRNPVAPAIPETHILDVLTLEKDDWISTVQQETGERIREQQAKDKIRFDKTRKTGKTYKEGELVRVERMVNFNDGKSKKLVAKYQDYYYEQMNTIHFYPFEVFLCYTLKIMWNSKKVSNGKFQKSSFKVHPDQYKQTCSCTQMFVLCGVRTRDLCVVANFSTTAPNRPSKYKYNYLFFLRINLKWPKILYKNKIKITFLKRQTKFK